MKIGIYGGSFNPIHFGHIGLAKWVAENTDLDEVWLMVSPNNPLKDKNILADEQERLAAAKQAIGDGLLAIGKRIIVSDFEFHLPRPTYTANTLRALVQEHPQHQKQGAKQEKPCLHAPQPPPSHAPAGSPASSRMSDCRMTA